MAAKSAGMEVLEFLKEPIAAALNHSRGRYFSKEKLDILVFDLGGGTFDTTVVEVTTEPTEDPTKRVAVDFKVLGMGGDNYLGGNDFDTDLGNYMIAKHFEMSQDERPENIKPATRSLFRAEARKAKHALNTNNTSTEVIIESPFGNETFQYDLKLTELD